MATREELLAELQRRGVQPQAVQAARQPQQFGREAILAEIQRRGVQAAPIQKPKQIFKGDNNDDTRDFTDIRNSDVRGLPSLDTSLADEIIGGAEAPDQEQILGGIPAALRDTALELAAGVNRGVVSIADIPADIANAVLQLSGAETRVPRLREQEFVQQATAGGFLEDPAARQAIGLAGEFLAPAPPVAALARQVRGVQAADEFANLFTAQSPTKQSIAKKLAEDPANKNFVKFVREGGGRVKKDKLATEAIKQGFDEGVIAAVKASSGRDKKKMKSMVDILKRGRENAIFATKNRPTDIAGRSLLERVIHVRSINKQSGKEVEKAAQSLKGQSVDFQPAVKSFIDDLSQMGVRIVVDNAGKIKPAFHGSDIEGVRGAESTIRNIVKRASQTRPPDAYDVHRMKKFIDEHVTFGKSVKGLGGKAERVLKGFRANLDGILDSNFPKYEKANRTFSETINALDSLQKSAGAKLDFFSPSADKATGTALRRLLSNTQSRAQMIDAIDEIEKVAKNTGAKFRDDITSQVLFADELDSLFGAAARTSLKGQAAQALTQGVELATSRGLFSAATDLAGRGVERARGINKDNAIKSIEKLLERK